MSWGREKHTSMSWGLVVCCLVWSSVLPMISWAQAPEPPDFVQASDGTYTGHVRITWFPNTNSWPPQWHAVYRHTTNDSGSASLLADYVGITNAAYDDPTAVAGQTYYYWMKAARSEGTNGDYYSSLSSFDTGYAAGTLPMTGSVSVVYPNGGEVVSSTVTMLWTVAGAPTSDTVSISYSDNAGSTWTNLATGVSASDEMYFWYSVPHSDTTQALWRISSEASTSYWDECNALFEVNNTHAPLIDVPTGVSATDGTYEDQVALSWNSVSGAVGYVVYRNTANVSSGAVAVAWPAGVTHTDTNVSAETTYWYWVAAWKFNGGTNQLFSDVSSSDSGYAQIAAPTGSLTVMYPNGGEVVSGTVTMLWDTAGAAMSGTVSILYSENAGSTWTTLASSVSAGDETHFWYCEPHADTTQALWRVESEANTSYWDQCNGLFEVNNGATGTTRMVYYLNDYTTNGDIYTTATGNDSNSGLSPSQPKYSLSSVLQTYDIEPGDTVWIDTGTYYPDYVTVMGAQDEGAISNIVTIRGSTNVAAGGSVMSGGMTNLEFVLRLSHADYVCVRDLTFDGGDNGLMVTGSVGCTLLNVEVANCWYDGMQLTASDVAAGHVRAHGNGGEGVVVYGQASVDIAQSTIFNNGDSGIYWLFDSELSLSNSIIVASGSSAECLYAETGMGADWYQGDYNDLYAVSNASIAYYGGSEETLAEWRSVSDADGHSLSHDPLFADAVNGDAHVKSSSGRYDPSSGSFVIDGAMSPCIDTAHAGSPYVLESAPNGGRANIGSYGNTAEASKSPTGTWVLATFPNDGGVVAATQTLQWAFGGMGGTNAFLDLDCSLDNGVTWTQIASGVFAYSDSYAWDTTGYADTTQGLWRVSDSMEPSVEDVCDRPFTIDNGSPSIATPTGLSATDGTFADRVEMTWNSVGDADGYYVYRNTSNTSSGRVVVGWPAGASHTDTNVSAGTTYWYWVRAWKSDGGTGQFFSGYSTSDSGYSQAAAPAPPASINASDGTYYSEVYVSWSSATNAAQYYVYRGTSNDSSSASQIATRGSTYYSDTTCVAGVTYYYWIRSWNSNAGVGHFSISDSGYRNTAPSAPTGMDASDGTSYSKVDLTWNGTTGADGYDVYRSISPSNGTEVLVQSNVSQTNYNDTTAVPGQVYYYTVKAYIFDPPSSQFVYSALSSPDTGYALAAPSAPGDVSATDGTYLDKVDVSWSSVGGVSFYRVFRATTNVSGLSSEIGTSAGTLLSDTQGVAGVTYYYWLKSSVWDGSTSQYVDSAFSVSDSGYANVLPVADLAVRPTNGFAPLRVTLDVSGSTDANGSIAVVAIDADGNGVYESSVSELGELVVEYTTPGTHYPVIRVTDNDGGQDTASGSVTVYGSGPTATLVATPTNGIAALTVDFIGTGSVATAGSTISVYEWDVDGDGSFEAVNTNGLFSWTYGAAGTNYATLRVTDNNGLQDSDTKMLIVSVPADPPVAGMSANPTGGAIPLVVNFTADVTGGGPIEAYKWDVDGDGAYDESTTNDSISYTYTSAGIYPASVSVVDDAGLSDTAWTTITASAPSQLRVWISTPKDGRTVWGETVSLRANTAPGSQTHSVKFEYKRADEPTWTALGDWINPPPYSFSTNWDVTALSDGSNYNLRAIGRNLRLGSVTSEMVTVTVDSGTGGQVGDIVETVVDGKKQKEETFSKDAKAIVGVEDGTRVIVPAGTVDADTTVKVVLTGANTNAADGSCAGKAAVDANRHVSLDGDPDLAKAITIIIPYPDEDNDGIVDGTGVPEMTLTAHWYDTAAGAWRRALSTEIFTDDNFLKATTYHLTEFGLFGSANLLHPANGSVLETFSSEANGTLAIANLTDDNTLSYWRSATNPAVAQEMVYTFKDEESALITGAAIYNHGEGPQGFSRTFAIQGSINGTDYVTLTNGQLDATKDAQLFDFGSVTCRTVKLVISDGVAADGWELAEFELYGSTTPDADGDTLEDRWEVQFFNDLVSNTATNDGDGDGLANGDEEDAGTDPTDEDSDDDRMSDGDEDIAGTSPMDGDVYFKIGRVDKLADVSGNLLGNPGFEEGWQPASTHPHWAYNVPLGKNAGSWGNVEIQDWRHHSGTNLASIRNWSDNAETGGWWQEITNAYGEGMIWEASAWIWNDDSYTNVRCEMKIEFLDGDHGWVDTVFHVFDPQGPNWNYVSGLATSPAGAAYVRYVMVAVGQGSSGAFQFDDVHLGPQAGTAWVAEWDSVLTRDYKVYVSADLTVWTNVVEQVSGTGNRMAYTNIVYDEASSFMRVTVERE